MTFIEFIGFIITLIAFFLLVMKQARDERKRRQNPEAYEYEEQQQQEAIKDLLRSLNIEVPEERPAPKPPPPPPQVEIEEALPMPIKESKIPQSMRLAAFDYGDAFRDPFAKRKAFEHGDAYVKRKQQQSRVKQLLRETDTLKDAVILKEVLGKPKGFE